MSIRRSVPPSKLLSSLATEDFEISTFDEGLQQYRQKWFHVDQLYRQFQLAARKSNDNRGLETLRDEVENHYVNKFLFPLGAAWQHQVDAVEILALGCFAPSIVVLPGSGGTDYPKWHEKACRHHL
jgi:hypothetical protein